MHVRLFNIILHVHVCVLLCVDNSYTSDMLFYDNYSPCVTADVSKEDEYLIT